MSYTKKTWASGDKVTSSALNNMEGGIDVAVNPFVVTLTPTNEDFSGTMDKTVAEINAAYEAGRKIVYKVLMGLDTYINADVTMVYFADGWVYPSFNAFIIDDGNHLLIEAATATQNDGTVNTYGTTIYPLTPMS